MNHLKIFFSTQARGAKTDLAKEVGVTKTWISQIISGKMKPSAQLAIKIELATGVSREKLRPDLFGGVHMEPGVEVSLPDQSRPEVAYQGPASGGVMAVRLDDGLPAV
jgi:DNA-binding transcriptional regulator YdaS (Cro superfamily)